MKNYSKILGIGILIFFVFTLLSPAGAQSQELETVNTGLEFTSTMPSVYGNIIICRTGEASIGPRAVDLNNDGDFNDYVVRYYNISTGESFNSGAEAENGVPMLWGVSVVFVTREGYVTQDLNGDNDWNDDVCMYYDVSAHKLFTTKGETLSIRNPQISGNIIAFVTPELAAGSDLDGDNSISNFVVRYFDIASGTLHNTGGTIYSSSNPVVSGNIIAFPANERDYKTFLDLNGDGDNFDMILMYYDVSSRALVNTGAVMLNFGYDVSGPTIAFLTFEGRIGADLNGDGDTSDTVVRYFDVSRGMLLNTGAEVAAGTSPTVKDGLITFISNELFVGSAGKDLNGDGDTSDNILRYYDSSAGRLINTGAECSLPVALSNGKIVAFATDEAMAGRLGADLNGDGDTSDRIVRYYDLTTGTVVNTKAETWTELGLSDSTITFGSAENRVGRFGEDLNGDGDKIDIVLRYITLGPILPNPPLASFTALPVSGEAPLTVQFTGTSTNSPDSWQWDFDNNGTIDSTLQNPSHTYNTPGTYSVSLTVSNQTGSAQETKPGLITVIPPDTTAPSVSITQPLDSQVVKDTIIIKATASDNKGVNRVEFYIDNTFQSADNISPYEYFWDTQTVVDGPYTLEAQAYDEAGNRAQESIAVEIDNIPDSINHPPVLAPIGNQSVDEGKELRFAISAADPDNDPLSYSATALPPGAIFSAQTFSFRPNFTHAGSYSVTFSVTDNQSAPVSETITITVTNVNRAPVLDPIGNKTIEEGKELRFTVSASDPDNDSLTYFASGLPSGANFSQATRTFSFRPGPEQSGDYRLRFEVLDGGLSDFEEITLSVLDVSEPSEEELSLQVNLKRSNCKLSLELIARSSLQPEAKLSYRLRDKVGVIIRQGQLFFKRTKGYYSKLISGLNLSSYTIELESDKGARLSQELNPFSQPDSLSLNLSSKPQGKRIQLGLEVTTAPFHQDNCLDYSLRDSSGRTIKQGHLLYNRAKGLYTKTLSFSPGDYQLLIQSSYGGRMDRGVRVE